MKLQHIDIDRLHVSPFNMRHAKRTPDISDILPSVRARGVLQPLLVRPNADGFEIVAGRRRYFAAREVQREQGKVAPLPCAVMVTGDDGAALEASLIENVARLDPDEMAQYDTFVRLIGEGKTVSALSATFGLAETVVKRRLALGNLLPKIKDLYRREEIDPDTIRHLTLATKAQQQEWLKLFRDDEAPLGSELKAWLFGGSEISTKAALFPLEDYKGEIVTDLFAEEGYFADHDQFWTLQNTAIAAKRDAYLAEGWRDVVVLEPGAPFHAWRHQKAAKKRGGKVFITVSDRGEVEVFEGFRPCKEADAQTDKNSEADEALQTPAGRAEVSSGLQNYIDLHRHAAARLALLEAGDVALRLIVATAIAGSPFWQAKGEPRAAKSKAIAESLATSPADDAFRCRCAEIVALLGFESDGGSLVQRGSDTTSAAVFATLLKLPNAEVMRVVASLAAETLAAGGALVEAVGRVLKVDTAKTWTPDDAFFDLVRERTIVNAMVGEIAGQTVADANLTERVAAQKQIVRDCLDGTNGRARVEGWLPRWLAFPPSAYTDRGGLTHVAAAEAIEEIFPAH